MSDRQRPRLSLTKMTGMPARRARSARRAIRRAVITARLAKARPPGKSRGLMASTIKIAVADFGKLVRVGAIVSILKLTAIDGAVVSCATMNARGGRYGQVV